MVGLYKPKRLKVTYSATKVNTTRLRSIAESSDDSSPGLLTATKETEAGTINLP